MTEAHYGINNLSRVITQLLPARESKPSTTLHIVLHQQYESCRGQYCSWWRSWVPHWSCLFVV